MYHGTNKEALAAIHEEKYLFGDHGPLFTRFTSFTASQKHALSYGDYMIEVNLDRIVDGIRDENIWKDKYWQCRVFKPIPLARLHISHRYLSQYGCFTLDEDTVPIETPKTLKQLQALSSVQPALMVNPLSDLEQQLDREAVKRLIEQLLRRLPTREKLLVGWYYNLFDEGKMNFEICARRLGISKSRTQSLMQVALRKLAKVLKKSEEQALFLYAK